MCNLSEGILERGIEQGIEQGIERGIEQGIEKTLINAYNAGMDMKAMKAFSGLDEAEIRQILEKNGYKI